MPTQAQRSTTVEAFLRAVGRSGLLTPEAARAAVEDAPADARGDADALAAHFVAAGHLSRFQADQLLQGTYAGLVLGPYRILSPLGKGGMGVVYLARDDRSDRLLALKVLPPARAAQDERMVARFKREMELSRQVAHPNLTQVYETGELRGVNYIAMEFIPGRSLYRLVNARGPLEPDRAARLFSDVANGLDHAHRRGLIHRDMKPSNIMVTPDFQAKVLDLGLALAVGEEPPADKSIVGGRGYVVGSMDYVAPEQTQNALAVDARCDLYGLGCSLYFALTGRPPFPGGTSVQKIMKHRTELAEPVSALNPAVPAGLCDYVSRLMSKTPEMRPEGASDVRDELLRWAAPAGSPSWLPDLTPDPDVEADAPDAAPLARPLSAAAEYDPVGPWDWLRSTPAAVWAFAAGLGAAALVLLAVAAVLLARR